MHLKFDMMAMNDVDQCRKWQVLQVSMENYEPIQWCLGRLSKPNFKTSACLFIFFSPSTASDIMIGVIRQANINMSDIRSKALEWPD